MPERIFSSPINTLVKPKSEEQAPKKPSTRDENPYKNHKETSFIYKESSRTTSSSSSSTASSRTKSSKKSSSENKKTNKKASIHDLNYSSKSSSFNKDFFLNPRDNEYNKSALDVQQETVEVMVDQTGVSSSPDGSGSANNMDSLEEGSRTTSAASTYSRSASTTSSVASKKRKSKQVISSNNSSSSSNNNNRTGKNTIIGLSVDSTLQYEYILV